MFTLETFGAVMHVKTESEKNELLSRGFRLVKETSLTDGPQHNNKNVDINSEADDDINYKTVPELKNIAKEKGIENYSSMKKEELINVLSKEVI